MQKIISNIKSNKWLLIILVFAAVLRFYKINFQSLWMDEIYTLIITNPENSFGTVITEVNNREGFPYLYFLLLKIAHTVFGYSPIVARVFSAMLGVLGVYAISVLGRKLYNKKAGIIAALLLCFSEYAIYISQDARPYSLYLFAVIISFIGLIDFLKEPNKKNAITYGLFAGLLLNINFFGLVNLLAQFFIVLLFFVFTEKKEKLEFIKKSFLAGGIAILLFLPNIYKLTTLFGINSTWIPAPTSDSFTILLKEFLGNFEITIFFFTPVFLYFLIKIFSTKEMEFKKTIRDKKAFPFIILFSWCFIVVTFLFLKSYLSLSLLIPRYFTSLLPALFLILGIGVAFVKNSLVSIFYVSGLVLFMFFNLTIVRGHYKAPYKTQFREAAALIINKNKNQEPVYTSLKYWFDYYLKDKFNVEEKPSLEVIINEMMQDPTKTKAFWYTDAHGRPFVLSVNAQQFVAENFYIDESFDGLDAWTKHYILLKDAKKIIDVSQFLPFKTYNGTPFAYSVESVENDSNMVNIKGWAYFDQQDAAESTIAVMLVKDETAKSILTQKVSRPDVTSYFKSKFDLSNAGFSSTVNLSELEPGTYSIAIYLENKTSKKIGLNISDKIIIKKD